jgi:hypothetical protein
MTQTIPKKSHRNLIVVSSVVVVLALVAGVYGLNTTGVIRLSPIPTPESAATNQAVVSASSLQFSVTPMEYKDSTRDTFTFYAKNIGTSDMMIRFEIASSGEYSVMNSAQNRSWWVSDGTWTNTSSQFSGVFQSSREDIVFYQSKLSTWAGTGDCVFSSSNGQSVRIFDIAINPELPDSMFEHQTG